MDHSYVRDLVNFGQITQAEARVHPKRNIITQVLGTFMNRSDAITMPGIFPQETWPGLFGMAWQLEDELLEEYLDKYGETGNILAKELIQYAIECGGADNITAAVIYNG